jgi:hypothetical protein
MIDFEVGRSTIPTARRPDGPSTPATMARASRPPIPRRTSSRSRAILRPHQTSVRPVGWIPSGRPAAAGAARHGAAASGSDCRRQRYRRPPFPPRRAGPQRPCPGSARVAAAEQPRLVRPLRLRVPRSVVPAWPIARRAAARASFRLREAASESRGALASQRTRMDTGPRAAVWPRHRTLLSRP